MVRVLVTGGAGYVGSHTCKALAAAGHEPVVYDSLARGQRGAVRWGPLEVGGLGEVARLSEVFRRYRPVAVLHFAAYIAAGESVEQPGAYYRNNVTGSLALLDTMLEHGVDLMVFSSTAAVYGNPQTIPMPETHAKQPINPYGWSKFMVEQILSDHSVAHGVRSVALRYFNAAGADSDGEIGECHDPETHLIPLVLQAAFGKRPSFTIFGTDYDTHDGTAIRDYIHVTDLAVAHVAALDYLFSGAQSTALNLGTGQGHS
ncbi:MAG: UDP-glucose 4-epimerase GalE, partial [Solirubrobacterales bacterium]